MQRSSFIEQSYDAPTIAFHWLTFALVVLQFTGAWTIDLFPSGSLRVDARSVHITLGALLGGVLVVRILWRVLRGRHLPPADQGVLNVLAMAMHYALYALLISMVTVGIGLAWARGDNLYGLFAIPAAVPGNAALGHQVQGVHGTIGWLIIAAVGLHASAALGHHLLLRDNVLRRMIPRA